jgi:hypothetical protein
MFNTAEFEFAGVNILLASMSRDDPLQCHEFFLSATNIQVGKKDTIPMDAYSMKTRFPHTLGPANKQKQLLKTVWTQLKLAKL